MGQGVNTKLLQVAATILSINPDKIKIETTNTTRVANASPSAASATADLNGKAVEIACNEILTRLCEVAAKLLQVTSDKVAIKNGKVTVSNEESSLTWNELITTAYEQRVNLSAKGHYSTPKIHFDTNTETGHPFSYHVYGTALFEITLDCIRGNYEIEQVDIVHDYGQSMNEAIDLGQIEGGLTQGVGWMTVEDLRFNEEGLLLSNALSTYKVPDVYAAPKLINVEALKASGSELAIFRSKAVGEPPLMYGIGAYFALTDAIRAYNPNYIDQSHAPMTPERVLMGLHCNKAT